jgi:hypothetical protein
MSANGPGRAEFESASHPDGHGTDLGQAGDRNRDQPGERTIVASDPSTGLAGEPYTFLASNYAACESGSIAFGCLSRS